MPSVDEILGAPPAQSVDDILGPAPKPSSPMGGTPEFEAWFAQTSTGKILDAFKQGAKDGWGTSNLGMGPETEDFLKKAGVFDDYADGQKHLLKQFNEAIIRPAVVAGDAAFRALNAGFGAFQEGVSQIGKETEGTRAGDALGLPSLFRDVAAMPEAFMGSPHPIGIPGLPEPIARAKSLRVIGDGEPGFMETTEAKPRDPEEAAAEAIRETPAETQQPDTTPAEPEKPDLHATARQIAPDVFNEYDDLSTRRDTFSRWMNELRQSQREKAEAPFKDEIDALNDKIDDATPRLQKKYAERIADLEEQRDAAVEQAMREPSADMDRVRQAYQETDYRMRDLAPEVSAAYREAESRIGPIEVNPAPDVAREPEVPPAPVQEPVRPAEPIPEPVVPKTEAAQPQAPAEPTTPEHAAVPPNGIAIDVAKKLMEAGRPEAEARAAASIISAYYETRANRFGGKRGTAEDLYREDAPQIRAGKAPAQRVKELAQKNGAKELEQARRGKISIAPDGKKIITLFKDADASTFIHETGHSFLEDLIADSNHEQATPDLKADAKSVLDWLGVKSAADIKTRQHEKFARGFERYLMEGVAPSKGLAHVFAQFRDWLTKIYQTVKNLKSPINDDIRGVFDRMLAEKPERTVIAPDRDTKGSFADIHEADAETTPPEKAHPVAETVQGERDKIAAERIPDDDHARLENTPDEARSRTAGSAEPDGHDDAAEPIAGEAGDAQGAGAVGPGGGETPRGGAGARAKPTEPPVGPNARFAEPESALVDKAGNIRLDKLNQPDDIDDAIREAARRNNDFIDQRRGVISDGQALDLAEALGCEPAFLDLKKIGDAFNEEEIIAAKKLLIRSATDVRDAMAKAATGTAEDVVALAQAITKHEMIQGKVAQATAEWGRAGRAFRMVMDGSAEAKDLSQFLKDNTGRSFNQLKQMAEFGQRLQTAGQVSRFIDQTAAGKVKRAIIYYYVNALISGPITHMRYSVGNAINAIWTPLVEVPVAATIGAVREAVAGHPIDRVYFGESAAQLYGVMKGSRDGLTAAIEAFRSGNSPALPKEKIASQFVDQPLSPVTGALSTAIGVPGRSVAAIHSFFKSLRYEQNIGALAYREAMKEGAQGPAFEYRVAELTRTPTDSMMEGATKDALKELYMSPTDYHSSMGALTRFTNQNLVAKIMMPFMKIGTQITRNAFVERTPLGLASSDVRGNLFSGMAKGDMQAAKITTGVALMGTTVLMASEGLATGDGPSDPATRAIWLMNHRPNSIQIGDITLPYQGLGHLGMLMRFSANMYETAHGWDGNDGAKLAVAGFEAITKSVLDENFMRGMKDALDALYHPAEYGGQYIRNFVTNWMPYSVGLSQVARQIDPYQRETHSIFEQAKAHVPWLSETLMPRRDRFGEPIPNGPPNPAYANDPTLKALDQLNVGIGKLDGKIRNVELTPKQYDDYARVAGRLTKMRLDQMVAQPGWQQIPPAIRVELIHSAISGSREAARATIMAENHGIIEAAVNAKVIPLQTGELKAKGPTKQKEAQ